MIKIYTDTAYLTPEYRRYIFPMLLDIHYLDDNMLADRYSLVNDIEECDIAVFPINVTHLYLLRKKKHLVDFIEKARAHNKLTWVFSGGDIGLTLPYNDIYVFRLGGFRSKTHDKTLVFPSFITDPYQQHLKKDFEPLGKTENPEIGFVGHAQSGFKKYLEEVSSHIRWNIRRLRGRAYTDYQPFYPSGVKRGLYLKHLQADPEIRCDFILRKKYRAGATTEEEKQRTTEAFFKNIESNLYTFCIRGHGNFSVRLYEVLAMGRIPVVVDTDCRYPLESMIDWKEHALIVPEENVAELPERLKSFHNSKSEAALKSLQEDNRALWKSKLDRIGYFKSLYDIFLNKIT